MPVTLLWGEEEYLIEKELNNIKKTVLGDEITELNYLTEENPDVQTFVYLLRRQPMMFGNIVCKIKAEKYFLEGGKKIKSDDKETAEIISALELVANSVHIVLVCEIGKGEKKKPDSRKKIYKTIQKIGEIKEFPAFKPWEDYKMLPVVKEMAADMGLKGDNAAFEEIIKRQGPYLRDIRTTLDKLSLYTYPENVIKLQMIDNVAPMSRNIFALTDIILSKDYAHAMAEIQTMLQKAHYLEILSFLQSGFSKILTTKVLSKSMSTFDVAKKTGQNEFIVKKTLEKLRPINLLEIIKLKQNLLKAEFEIKTGEKEAATALLEAFTK